MKKPPALKNPAADKRIKGCVALAYRYQAPPVI